MKKALAILALALLALTAHAQEEYPHRLSMQVEFTMSDAGLAEIGYHYMISPYYGIGCGVGCWRDIDYHGVFDDYDDDRPPKGFFIRPSLLFETPALLRFGEEGSLTLQCEPSVMACTKSTFWATCELPDGLVEFIDYKTDINSWRVKIAASINFGEGAFSLGYSVSSMDIDRAYKFQNGSYRYDKQLVHGINIALCYRF